MYFVEVFIEHPVRAVDQVFTYIHDEMLLKGTRVKVNFNNRFLIGFVEKSYELETTLEEYEEKVGYKLKNIEQVIDQESLLNDELYALSDYMKDITLSTKIACYQVMLPSVLKPQTTSNKIIYEDYVVASGLSVSLTPKQLDAYQFVLAQKEVKYSELRKKYPTIAKKLVDSGALKKIKKEKEVGINKEALSSNALPLTKEQQAVKNEFENSTDQVFLLHGVTGAGKTEVYLQIAEEVLKQNKQVLILVPEIALTPQMIERVASRFGHLLAIYHSRLTAQQKYEQYQLVKNKQASIVVGTRSAVFLPFDNLGLIIMDEEHDASYKQDNQPSYHCRDIAIWRGKYHNCKVLLGSATPSLESYARALKKVYHLLTLDHRINKSVPDVHIVSMQDALKTSKQEILSNELKEKIQDRLDKHEQVILLLNRRGYYHVSRCRECNEPLKCPHCDLALHYHYKENCLKCHTCGATYSIPKECPSCHSRKGFASFGYGTEKLMEVVQNNFPTAKLLRMDADTTSQKDSHEKILKAFGNHEADILVGTQMIAKGLDFASVTLVGILNGDDGLARTDFRSCEVTFDLLMQASGRSGRSDKNGEVILQVFNPDHYAVTSAASQDYVTFFRNEMKFRHTCDYPPYSYFISLTAYDVKEKKAEEIALWMKNNLKGNFKSIGVVKLLKIKDQYRYRVLLKGKDLNEMRNAVRNLLDTGENKKKNIHIDVNPMVIDL